jgi:hypothetical protein
VEVAKFALRLALAVLVLEVLGRGLRVVAHAVVHGLFGNAGTAGNGAVHVLLVALIALLAVRVGVTIAVAVLERDQLGLHRVDSHAV